MKIELYKKYIIKIVFWIGSEEMVCLEFLGMKVRGVCWIFGVIIYVIVSVVILDYFMYMDSIVVYYCRKIIRF